MNRNQTPLQNLHEVAFSVNLAFALVAFVFLFDFRFATLPLFRMNVAICRYLHLLPNPRVPKDFYTSGYFAFWVPAIVLATCFWALLRRFSQERFVRTWLLRCAAGITALAAPPVWWLCSTYLASRKDGWRPLGAIQFYEVVLVLACAAPYLSGNRPVPQRASIVFLLGHFGFWLWQFGTHPFFMGYGGPVAPTVGLCAGLTWISYILLSGAISDGGDAIAS
jgi:hypothetical protein